MVKLTGNQLSVNDVLDVARGGGRIEPFDAPVRERMQASRDWVDSSIHEAGSITYGVNTGFGPLATKTIAPAEAGRLSRNVILSCLSGVGPPLQPEIVRAMMVIRANTFANGLSGVRPVVADTLCRMINAGVTPYVPSKGSLGASGDLAPLAHIAVVLTRESDEIEGESGRAWFEGELLTGAEAMRRAGIPRLVLGAKEGLSLTNGTDMMLAHAALGLSDGFRVLANAVLAAALSLEALQGLSAAFTPELHAAGGQPGQLKVARRILELTEGSQLVNSDPGRIQDAYSLRCTPQVLGPIRDTLKFIEERISTALNSVSDNPLILPGPDSTGVLRAVSGGNFHGQGLAMWLDFMGIAVAEIGNISERRTFRLTTPELSVGLPSMLVASAGLDSGLMIPQYTAAALVSENKTLAHPDSVDSIPSSGNQEDHVSMGANAARHALEIIDNVRKVVAIELLTASQGVDLRPDGPDRLGKQTGAVYRRIREEVAFLEHDRALTPDIERIAALIAGGDLIAAAASA